MNNPSEKITPNEKAVGDHRLVMTQVSSPVDQELDAQTVETLPLKQSHLHKDEKHERENQECHPQESQKELPAFSLTQIRQKLPLRVGDMNQDLYVLQCSSRNSLDGMELVVLLANKDGACEFFRHNDQGHRPDDDNT